ncbi:hypothetical protein ABEB33_21920 [Herbaspirillum huttiense]|uniref:hypothetical protein n=1 Tax=Herbaspirillum huttiense TaxID=863372 RepID=UPI003878390E
MNNVRLQRPQLPLALILGVLCIAVNVALHLWGDGDYLLLPLVLPLVLTWQYIFPSKSGSLLIAALVAVAGLYMLWNVVFMLTLLPLSLLPTSYLALMALAIGLLVASLFLIMHASRIKPDPVQSSSQDGVSVPEHPKG